MKVATKTCRIKKYVERSAQYQQNKLFLENANKFYYKIMGKISNIKKRHLNERS